MTPSIAWIAQGKLRVKNGDEAPRTVESQFGQTLRERAVRSQQRHAWKMQGAGEKFLGGAMLWGRTETDPAAIPITITSLCRGSAAGQVLYSLETDDLCAILAVENLGTEERRLWNKNDKRLSHLCVASDGAVACSVRHPFGTANVAVRLDEESGFSEVTEGDSFDAAPRWVPGPGRRIVFQSAGVGRDRNGQFAGLGPFGIQLLDVDRGELETVLEDPKYDFLTPQLAGDGTLFYLRRPYRTGHEIHPLRFAKDVLLFPFRLALAIFHYLQFFSMRYTGKKLTTSGGARGRELDLKQMMIWGNAVSAQHASQTNTPEQDLVPATWQLVRRSADGKESIVAKGVLGFDLSPDGSVVYSNGNAIFLLDSQGHKTTCVSESMIEQVAVLSWPTQQA